MDFKKEMSEIRITNKVTNEVTFYKEFIYINLLPI